MSWDNTFEEKITEGKVQIIRNFTLDFDKVAIIFENSYTGTQKCLNFSRVFSLEMQADCLDEWNKDMDIMAYRTLVGFHFELTGNVYRYLLKIEDYEIVIKSLNFVTLSDNPAV